MSRAAIFSVSILVSLAAATALGQSALEKSFRDPPREARPHTWWHWMNGNVTRAGITADLEAMKQIGLGGAQIFNVSEGIPEGPIQYNSDEWRGLVKFAAEEAKRVGIELCVHNCAGWSSSGGPWVTPEHAMQRLTTSETRIAGGTKAGSLAQPASVGGYYSDIAVLAFPTPKDDKARIDNIGAKALFDSQYGLQPVAGALPRDAAIGFGSIVDITSHLRADGSFAWEAPPGGEWTVLRIGHTLTGAMNAPSPTSGRGLEVDKMSREALDAFWAGGMQPLLKSLGPLAGSVLNNSLVDSYEMGPQNWTPRFREEFRARRGYDPLLYLPVVTGRIVGSPAESERFLWDFRRTIGDLFTDNYYTRFSELCKGAGIMMSVEPYDGPFECQQVGRDADIVMGEFWVGGGMPGSCKLASSVGHVYGKKFIGAEAFTAFPTLGKWLNTPRSLKGIGDLMYTSGINRYIMHRYAHQPWADVNPGMTMGQWGTHFERTTTWWEPGAAWIMYLSRCQSLLQQGTFVGDVVYFIGESSPNGYAMHDELKHAGFDYDMCGTDVLIDRMGVKNGRLVLPSGMSYRLLVLPDTPFMTPKLAAKVRDLVKAGANVIGPRPLASPSNAGDDGASLEVAAIGSDVWGDCDGAGVKRHAYGRGVVYSGQSPMEVLAAMSVAPDVSCAAAREGGLKPKIAWIHRNIDGADVYFVSNQRARAEEVKLTFRVSDRTPELWHAETGETEAAPVWSLGTDGRTSVSLRLESWGSAFVVFREKSGGAHVASITPPGAQGAPGAPKVVVNKAMYEAIDGAGGVDVTKIVASMVDSGEGEIPANNGLFGDPTYNHRKRLRVEYTIDGKEMNKSADENATLVIFDSGGPGMPFTHRAMARRSGVELQAFRAGVYGVTRADGQATRVEVKSVPTPIEVVGPWSVKFQKDRGAPGSISMGKLASLSESNVDGVRYFSGAADYEATFTLPAGTAGRDHAVRLSLGGVRDIAEVWINGKSLGVWWRDPFEGDVSSLVKDGSNTLRVRVTNTWVNRLVGDEQLPDDCEWNGITIKSWPDWFKAGSAAPLRERPEKGRFTFTTWKHWHKDSALPESGLLGPVKILVGTRVKVE